ncbi:MAG: ribosomal protein L11 methyltransferase [Gammaproteobacteria bacterium]|jgi:ribosomal protein L11 methyltransferase
MSWLEIRCTLPSARVEAAEFVLEASGAVSVTFTDANDQPILEPALGTIPLWDFTVVTGLYTLDADVPAVMTLLSEQLTLRPDQISCTTLEDQEWTRAWMSHFKPMDFGQKLAVCPTGFEPVPNRINLKLDPGLAFGTGTHATTRLCLEWLDTLACSGKLEGKTVIDYGSGSGILAIGAALLGAKHVVCVDNDPQALTATLDNAQRNRVEAKISVYLPDDLPADTAPADVMVANILANPLIELSERICGLTAAGGALGLSGILAEQAGSVVAAYRSEIDSLTVSQNEDWVRVDGTKSDS